MSYELRVEGLAENLARLRAWPDKLRDLLRLGMQSTLLVMQEHVPDYPPQPVGSDYVRTGTLGRSLGARGGQADIYEVREGSGYTEGAFGSRLGYARYVVGDYASQQAGHMRHWWTVPQDLLRRSLDKIEAVWTRIGEEIIAWFNQQ